MAGRAGSAGRLKAKQRNLAGCGQRVGRQLTTTQRRHRSERKCRRCLEQHDEWSRPECGEAGVAIASEGAAWTIWQGQSAVIRGAARPAGGTWQLPVSIGEGGPGKPELAMSSQGNAVAVWGAGGGRVQASSYEEAPPPAVI